MTTLKIEGMDLTLTPQQVNLLLAFYYEEEEVAWMPKHGPECEELFEAAKQLVDLHLLFLTGEEKRVMFLGPSFRGGLTEMGFEVARKVGVS